MKKKLVVINGSYHKQGMTVALTDAFIKGFLESNPEGEVKNFSLMEKNFDYCKGCWQCTKQPGKIGECVIKDEVEDMLPYMHECDVLVWATPVYEFGPTAVMKKFMERNLPIIGPVGFLKGRNPKRKDKVGVILLSSGAPWPINVLWGVTRYPTKILKWLSKLWSCGKIHTIKAGGMEINDKIKNKFVEKSYRLGLRLGR